MTVCSKLRPDLAADLPAAVARLSAVPHDKLKVAAMSLRVCLRWSPSAERGKPDWLLHSEAIQVYGAGWPRTEKWKFCQAVPCR